MFKDLLSVLLICAWGLLGYVCPSVAANESEFPLNLPPISVMDKVTVVLTPETAFPLKGKTTWALIPRLSLIPKDSMPSAYLVDFETVYKVTDFYDPTARTEVVEEDDPFWEDESLIAFAKDIAEPISTFMFDDNLSSENPEYMRYLYADLSALAFSHFIRGVTNNQLDLYLLTSIENSKSLYINGLEMGFRPDPFLGFRVRVRGDNETTTNNYGFELHLYPTDYMLFKIVRDDNKTEQRTGLELNMTF